jgi:dihydrofolate reductase
MAKVIGGMAMSLDGFVNDRDGSVERLYADFEALRESEVMQQSMATTGAVIMGRRSYEMGQGDYTGYEYQVPIFVVTHEAPNTVAKGENDQLSFTFVTDGVESAVAQARAAAGDRNVTVVGGADTVQQLLRAGLLDELEVSIVPVLLGEGLRLFEHLGETIELEQKGIIETPGRIDLTYRVVK